MLEDIAIVNASPLVVLGRVRRLPLLQLVANRILIPNAVLGEVRGHDDEASSAIITLPWMQITDDAPIPPEIVHWDLGAGESSVLSLASMHSRSIAVLDDLQARRCARVLGVRVKGTLGLVLLAKQKGILSAARPVIAELREAGLYLSESVVNEAVRLVGE